jgi:hypothetical protein
VFSTWLNKTHSRNITKDHHRVNDVIRMTFLKLTHLTYLKRKSLYLELLENPGVVKII